MAPHCTKVIILKSKLHMTFKSNICYTGYNRNTAYITRILQPHDIIAIYAYFYIIGFIIMFLFYLYILIYIFNTNSVVILLYVWIDRLLVLAP